MPLHMIKLCVGVSEIAQLAAFQKRRFEATGGNAHITRMTPRRAAEILDGGSLYWVMNGMIMARQRITAIEPFMDDDGIRRCKLELDMRIVPVAPQPRRPFQGWRYLKDEDAPRDLETGDSDEMPPEDMRRGLGDLGLI